MTRGHRGGWQAQIFQQHNPIILKILKHGAIDCAAHLVYEAEVINDAIKLAEFLKVRSESMTVHISALVIGNCQWEHQNQRKKS